MYGLEFIKLDLVFNKFELVHLLLRTVKSVQDPDLGQPFENEQDENDVEVDKVMSLFGKYDWMIG